MSRYVTRLPVRFNEIDAAGIVYYPRFFDYFHMAFEDFFGAATGTPYHVWIKERRIGWPTVHIDTDFRSPLRYGDTVEVAVSFPKVGRSSIVARYEASTEGRLCCVAEITSVTTQLDRLESMELPQVVREALARYPGI
ncbi:acyl-CoA thioesterase [Vulgatibacter sp.]|uniref:acyl-CoA thioesterase n=1 Tax=Vulgatibacter sp. TaxID=1971226 RepID=UPI003569F70D